MCQQSIFKRLTIRYAFDPTQEKAKEVRKTEANEQQVNNKNHCMDHSCFDDLRYSKTSLRFKQCRSRLPHKDMGLRPLACWDCGFESPLGHSFLSVLNIVCCQVEVSVTGRSLVQRSLTECGVLLSVVRCNSNLLHLQ